MRASSYEGIRAASMVTPSLDIISDKLWKVLPFINNADLRIKILQSLLESAIKRQHEININ